MKFAKLVFFCLCCLEPIIVEAASQIGLKKQHFVFFGTELSVKAPNGSQFQMSDTSPESIEKAWSFANQNFQASLKDCLSLKEKRQLNDWGYIQMIDSLRNVCIGDENTSELYKAWILANSGYRIKLAKEEENFRLLICTDYSIFYKWSYNINGDTYYSMEDSIKDVNLVDNIEYPLSSKKVSFTLNKLPILKYKASQKRTIETQFESKTKLMISYDINENLMNFYMKYPSVMKNSDFVTRWAILANTPLDENLQKQIYPQLRAQLKGNNKVEAVGRLLNLVQTGIKFEYDDVVWGNDRAFFAEELLYYPYGDSEDRAILFSRLVRDLTGLQVVLLYFPGHLATGVCFEDEYVEGDEVFYNGDRFVICDPSIDRGSPVGWAKFSYNSQAVNNIVLLH